MSTSGKFTAAACTRTRTRPGPGSGSGRSSTVIASGRPCSLQRAALIAVPVGSAAGSAGDLEAVEFVLDHALQGGCRRLRQRDRRVAGREQYHGGGRGGHLAALVLAPQLEVHLVAAVDLPLVDHRST